MTTTTIIPGTAPATPEHVAARYSKTLRVVADHLRAGIVNAERLGQAREVDRLDALRDDVLQLSAWIAARIDPASRLMDSESAASYLRETYGLGVCGRTVKRRADAGLIENVRGRFTREMLDFAHLAGAFERGGAAGDDGTNADKRSGRVDFPESKPCIGKVARPRRKKGARR